MDPHKKAWPEFHFIIHQTLHLLKIYLILHISFSCVCGLCWKRRQYSSIHIFLEGHHGESFSIYNVFIFMSQKEFGSKKLIMTSLWSPQCGRLYNVESMLGLCKHFISEESLGLQRYGLGGRPSSQWLPDSCAELAGPHRC